MTDDERRALAAFRRIPESKMQAYWSMVDALADTHTATESDSLPDRQESD